MQTIMLAAWLLAQPARTPNEPGYAVRAVWHDGSHTLERWSTNQRRVRRSRAGLAAYWARGPIRIEDATPVAVTRGQAEAHRRPCRDPQCGVVALSEAGAS